MIPQKTIEELIEKHSILEKDLSSGKIDKKLFAEKSKEYSDLNEIINDAKQYISFEKDKTELEKIINDQNSDDELLKMAEIEFKDLQNLLMGLPLTNINRGRWESISHPKYYILTPKSDKLRFRPTSFLILTIFCYSNSVLWCQGRNSL